MEIKKIIYGIEVFIILALLVISFNFHNNQGLDVSPAKLKVKIITSSNCQGCFDTEQILTRLMGLNAKIVRKEYYIYDPNKEAKKSFIDKILGKENAKDLIEKYNITRLPAVIIEGETFKHPQIIDFWNLTLGRVEGNTIIIESPEPPFYYIPEDKLVGFLEVIIIKNPDCGVCKDAEKLLFDLQSFGVGVKKLIVYNYTSPQAQELIKQYNIEVLPAIIFSEDAKYYSSFIANWRNIGTIEEDGKMVARYVSPPYYNLTSGKIEGIVNVTLLYDSQCKYCYDPLFHVAVFRQNGIYIGNITKVDIRSEEGQKLLFKYNITKVPTAIFSSEAMKYSVIRRDWPQLGFVAPDGKLVFTNFDKISKKIGGYETLVLNYSYYNETLTN